MAYINGKKVTFSAKVAIGETPSGTIEITENGTHDVSEYASANVNVSGGGGGELGQPDADMVWLKSVGDSDVQEGFTKKIVIAITNFTETTDFSWLPDNGAIKTSDGGYYTEAAIHTWNDANVHQSQVDSNIKLRWIIFYWSTSLSSVSAPWLYYYSPLYIYAMNVQYRPDIPSFTSQQYMPTIGIDANAEGLISVSSNGNNYTMRFFPALKYLNNYKISVLSDSSKSLMEGMHSIEYLPTLDFSEVTYSSPRVLHDCRSLKKVGYVDIGQQTSLDSWFYNCHKLQDQVIHDFTNITDLDNTYCYCESLKQVNIDTTNVLSMISTFYACSSLEKVSPLNLQSCESVQRTFERCSALKEVELINTSKSKSFYGIFTDCFNLKNVSPLDLTSATNLYSGFHHCHRIKEIKLSNTGNVTTFQQAFGECKEATTIGTIDMQSVTTTSGASSMFSSCKNLTNLTLKNIKVGLMLGSGTTYGHLLTVESLLNTIKELWNMTDDTTKTLTMGSTNLEKLANVYVKLIDITDDMRAEDEYIDNKLPFEVCESTDEGAMLINTYAGLKNWEIK